MNCEGLLGMPVHANNFINRISRDGQGFEGVQFSDIRIRCLFLADDVVLLAPSVHNLQLSLHRIAAECEADENQHL